MFIITLAIGNLRRFTLLLVPAYFSTFMAKHRALIIGHSFVHRLAAFLQKKRHMHALTSLRDIADIHFHDVGGCTIGKFRKFDLEFVRQIAPKIIILELGSNSPGHYQKWIYGDVMRNGNMAAKARHTIQALFGA